MTRPARHIVGGAAADLARGGVVDVNAQQLDDELAVGVQLHQGRAFQPGAAGAMDFVPMILDSLRIAGVPEHEEDRAAGIRATRYPRSGAGVQIRDVSQRNLTVILPPPMDNNPRQPGPADTRDRRTSRTRSSHLVWA